MRKRFARYLELCGPGWENRAVLLGATAAERDSLLAEFAGKLLAVGTPARTIVTMLGSPDLVVEGSLSYVLGLRQDLIFEFSVAGDEALLVGSGYQRIADRSLGVSAPQTTDEARQLRATLRKLAATGREVARSLSEPDAKDGWWPLETWKFGEFLTLELRLGVVEGSD
jgi:hypothetical protein